MADQISEFTRRAFSAHRDLPACLVALLKELLADRLRKMLKQCDIATAGALARLAATDAAAGLVYELKKGDTLRCDTLRPLLGDYKHPTIDALLWRDLELQELLRADPQHEHKLQAYKCAARHETSWRACLVIELLSELAKMTTQQPDERSKGKIDRHRRSFEAERRAWKLLCAEGLADEAEPHRKQALKHLVLADILARPDRDELLRVIFWRLARHFGFRANRIAAALVSAALELKKPISPRHTRYVGKSFYVAKNRRAIS
jgi:hypothetical protein